MTTKFKEPQRVVCEDGDVHWIVEGHDRPEHERFDLMFEYDLYLKATQTWARILPSGGRPGFPFYVDHSDRYEGQRGAFPCTAYTVPDVTLDMMRTNQLRKELEVAQGQLERVEGRSHEPSAMKRIARLRRNLAMAEQLSDAFHEMAQRFDDGEDVDLIADIIEAPTPLHLLKMTPTYRTSPAPEGWHEQMLAEYAKLTPQERTQKLHELRAWTLPEPAQEDMP